MHVPPMLLVDLSQVDQDNIPLPKEYHIIFNTIYIANFCVDDAGIAYINIDTIYYIKLQKYVHRI